MLLSVTLLVSVYSVLIGVFMMGFWTFALYSDMIPPEEKPWAITFHLFSEFSTATLLIVSGVASLLNMDWAKSISLIALGMLMYIVIYSPGYYLQKKNKPMALMFVALIILTAAAITATLMFT